jgi:hypothetical protein
MEEEDLAFRPIPIDVCTVRRKQRAFSQKLFLIETCSSTKYVVMGSTGNVYDVLISRVPLCTCPDNTVNKRRCKHIYFILCKVMKFNDPDKDVFSDEDIELMLSNIRQATELPYVDGGIKHAYEKLKNTKNTNKKIVAKDDDICPICLDDLHNGDEFDFCEYGCGKCVHKVCFNMWCTRNDSVCLICKKPWNKENKYVNLLDG